LAAAHAAGLVHRDFKPTNVLVGEDGRARVVDFGLVAASYRFGSTAVEGPGEVTLPASALDVELTEVGTVLGTAAYMSPEQFLALPTDARTDQFSFCVALYRALYGVAPFEGDSQPQLRSSVTRGELRQPPSASAVPGWLRPILARGMATRPEERFPAMEPLLEALSRDPIVLARQRRRTAALMLAAATVAVLGLLGVREAWTAWQRAKLEQQASAHRAAVEDQMARLRAEGREEQADEAFEAFASMPEYQGTAALTEAWIHRGREQAALHRYAPASASFARAYTASPHPELADEALLGLAESLWLSRDWPAAARALQSLEARDRARAREDDALALQINVALALRDYGRAAELAAGGPEELRWLVSFAGNLSRATPTPYETDYGVVLRGPDRLLLGRDHAPALVRLDPTLSRVSYLSGRVSWASRSPAPSYTFAFGRGPDESVTTLFRSFGERLEPVTDLDHTPLSIEVGDLDADGREEIYLGSRALVAIQEQPDGSWRRWEPHPETSQASSDINDLQVADLDGDGRDELIVASGPWRSYDLRVLAHDPGAEELRLRARAMIGTTLDIDVLKRADGTRVIAAVKIDMYANTLVFPPEHPFGGPMGVYLFKLEGDELVLDTFLPAPLTATAAGMDNFRVHVGDVDGDGIEDMVINVRTPSLIRAPWEATNYALVLRQRRDGSFSSHMIARAWVLAIAQLDGDPEAELVMTHYDDDMAVWVLGVGDQTPPLVRQAGAIEARRVPSPTDDPALARRWERAEDLVALGLDRDAARSHEGLAVLATRPELQRAAWTRAAELHAKIRQDHQAAALFERVADGAHPETLLDAARSFHRAGEHADALRVLERLFASRRVDAGVLEEARALQDKVRTLAVDDRAEFTFAALAPGWQLSAPQSLERLPERPALRIRAIGQRELASHPIRWSGRDLVMTADLELTRGEWASGFTVALERDGEASPITLAIETGGGARQSSYSFVAACGGGDSGRPMARRNGRLRLRMRLTYTPGERSYAAEFRDLDADAPLFSGRFSTGDHSYPPGEYRLVLRSHSTLDGRIDLNLERVELLGATAIEGRGGDDEAARALVEGRPGEALAALTRRGRDEDATLRIIALTRLGRWSEVPALLAALLTAEGGDVELATLLRHEPSLYFPLLREAIGDDAFALLRDAWLDVHEAGSSIVGHRAILLPLLADLEALDDGPLLASWLVVRGDLRRDDGDREGARADYGRALELVTWGGPEDLRVSVSELRLELASLAAADGDLEAALTHVTTLMGQSATPEVMAAKLRARPELRSLHGDPEWEAVLGADDRLLTLPAARVAPISASLAQIHGQR
ncbi:MAG: FG-GAP-like repeat-containing protein, partial [Nannocystaceae bacterium]